MWPAGPVRRPLRVAFFAGSYNHVVDGVVLTSNRQVAYLEQQGVPVRVYAPTTATPALQHAGTLVPIPSVGIPNTPYRVALGLPRSARRDLEAFRPTLVHLATPDWLGAAALRWAERHNIPAVATYHTHFNSYLKFYRLGFLGPLAWFWQRRFYGRCAEVYVAGRSMADELRAHGLDAHFVYAPFGVDHAEFSPQKRSEEWRARHGFKPGDVVVAFVGRLAWEKGLELFAQVVSRLEAEHVPHRSLVVGEGPAGPALRRRLPNTVFTGWLNRAEVAMAFASADVFFYPSASETFGCVTVEALSCALPCVVADAAGSRDIVRNDVDGLICPPEDATAFFNAVTRLCREPETRDRLRVAGLARAAEFRWEVVLDQMLANFRRASEGGGKN
jgi:glycosyltransferase involved in cell wall biosynthesis